MHPRNRYQGHYDLRALLEQNSELARFAQKNQADAPSIDFSNPDAVKALNRTLLRQYYGIVSWEIPPQNLCPPIPGRADYIHQLADLLAVNRRANGRLGKDEVPRDAHVLDVGVGASCIYPIIGHGEYGWTFVGSDIDRIALESSQRILDANPSVASSVELRWQSESDQVFKNVVQAGERFDLVMCNPPFHASAEEAQEVNRRKWKNLGRAPVANFGGQSHELWVEGGEAAFVGKMIRESRKISDQVLWFTSLVSKEATLPTLYDEISKVAALEYRVMNMSQGQKKSRLIAWTFIGGKKEWGSIERHDR